MGYSIRCLRRFQGMISKRPKVLLAAFVATSLVAGCAQVLSIGELPGAVDDAGHDATAREPDAGTGDGGMDALVGDDFSYVAPNICLYTNAPYVFDGSILTPSCLSCALNTPSAESGASVGDCPGTIAACAASAVCSCLVLCLTECSLDGGAGTEDGGAGTNCVNYCMGYGQPDTPSIALYTCLENTCAASCNPL